jgi:hypothetical protein
VKIKNFFFVSLSFITLAIPAKALVTIGGQDIKDFLPDENKELVYSNTQKHVAFRFRQGNLIVGELKIKDLKEVMGQHRETYKAAKRITLFSPTLAQRDEDLEVDTRYIVAGESIRFSSKGQITVKKSVLNCEEPISFEGQKLVFASCLTTHSASVTLLPSEPTASLLRGIKFVANNSLPSPYKLYIKGSIDFEGNETLADLVVVGASEVRFLFAPEAFN